MVEVEDETEDGVAEEVEEMEEMDEVDELIDDETGATAAGFLAPRGKGGPTITFGRTDLGGMAVVGINVFNLSISGTRTGGGDEQGGSGGGEVEGGG